MNKQINLRLPNKVLESAKRHAKKQGYGTVQEFIKETIREKLFGPELTREEYKLIKKLIEVTKKHDLYATEEEMWAALRRK